MQFKVLKSGFDGISGGTSRYDSIEEALAEISYHKGWDTLNQLKQSVRKWAAKARPGDIYTTVVSAIVAIPADVCNRQDDICHHCDFDGGLEYEDIEPVEATESSAELNQKVTCPECGKKWIDVFTLSDQRELVS